MTFPCEQCHCDECEPGCEALVNYLNGNGKNPPCPHCETAYPNLYLNCNQACSRLVAWYEKMTGYKCRTQLG